MDGGGARMVLLATCQLIEEADLPFGDDAESRRKLNACFDRAAEQFHSTRPTIKRLYESMVESAGAYYSIADTNPRLESGEDV